MQFNLRRPGRNKWTATLTLASLVALALSTPANAQPSVWTEHSDNARTGQNMAETVLTPSNVNQTTFGALFHYTLDDQTYSQPLYIPSVTMAVDGKVHNVVYVATCNNSVYAFDADSNTANGGNPLWHVSLTPSGARPPNVNDADAEGACGGAYADIAYNYGIIGTPVIDTTTNTLYVVARDVENGSTFVQRLHALDITSGAEKFGGPVVISGSYSGANWDPALNNQRPALTLMNGVVYIAWSSHCDNGGYHGFIMGYNASTLAQEYVWSDTNSNGSQGGIWQGGQGVTSDGSHNIYVMTGNGTWDGSGNFGESFVKLNSSLAVQDYFTPNNYSSLNGGDEDLGAAGCLGIPGTELIVGGGKQGMLYLVDTANMGHENSTDAVVQEFQATFPTSGTTGHIHGGPVYFDSANGQFIYVWGEDDYLRVFQFTDGSAATTGSFNTTAVATSTMKSPTTSTGMPGGFISISANGTSNGIAWALTPYNGNANQGVVQGILHAFNASTFTSGSLTELWNSKQNVNRDDFGNYAKFTYPTVANGHVYVSSWGTAAKQAGQLWVYGILPSSTPAAPTSLTAVGENNKVQLAWNASGGATAYSIYRGTTSGGESSTSIASGITSTNYTDATAANGTKYYYKVAASNSSGTSSQSSSEASATASATGAVPVNFTSYYNVTGIYTDGADFSAFGGLDAVGNSYSATALGASLTWNGIPFLFGFPNEADCVTSTTINLPSGQYTAVNLLATAVEGNQASQTFTVTYSDGSTSTFTQSMSDWFTPQSYSGESVALAMSYRDNNNGTKDARTFNIYGYSFAVTSTKTIKSITLPSNQDVVVMAISLTPVAAASPTFTLSASPASTSVTQGGTATSTITVNPQNGFNSSVSLSASGLPSGVTAAFNPTSTTTTSTVTFTAAGTATTGTSTVTITGTSGSLTETTTVALTVNASTAGTTNYVVTLTPEFNTYAIATDGATFTAANSLDTVGDSYSATELGTSATYGGQSLPFGIGGQLNGVNNAKIAVEPGQYTTLRFLGCAVEGSQASQTFTATYSDGSTQTFTLSVSDWAHPQSYSGETTVVTSTYRDQSTGAKQTETVYLYGYTFTLNSAKTLTSLTLPSNRDVIVLAMGVTGTLTAPITNAAHQLTPECATSARLWDTSGGTANGTAVEIYQSGSTNESWTFSNASVAPAGDYNLAINGPYCLQAGGSTSGSAAEMWGCDGATSQAWNITADASPSGYYELQPANQMGLCLDVNGAGTANGTAVQVYYCNNTNAQQWQIQ